jgi:hypothetical protein
VDEIEQVMKLRSKLRFLIFGTPQFLGTEDPQNRVLRNSEIEVKSRDEGFETSILRLLRLKKCSPDRPLANRIVSQIHFEMAVTDVNLLEGSDNGIQYIGGI